MKKIWIIIIVLVVLAALAFLGLFIYDSFFYYDDDLYYEDDEYEDDEYEDDEYEDDEYEDDEYVDDEETSAVSSTKEASESLANLIVLLEFEDQELVTKESDWEEFFFGNTSSVKSYFNDMSKGSFEILSAKESYGATNDGVIIVSIDQKHPNLTSDSADKDYDVLTKIFEEMLDKADEYIDFSQYDANNDGSVLAAELSINMVIAGYEENDYSEGKNQVSGICINEEYFIMTDGVGLGDYIVFGELDMLENGRSDIVTIGVSCHETAHVLGLPDLYDTDYSSIGLGFHALMSEGNNNRLVGQRLGETPSPMMAWSRIYAGFIQPEVISRDGVFTLFGQSTTDYNVIRIDGDDGYYLIENVDFNGYGAGIAEYMETSGIAIWYVDDDVVTEENILNNEINNEDRKRGVILIESSGKDDLYEETLEYDNPDYNHYFASDDIDEYTTKEGVTIKILDTPGIEMEVEINFSN